VTSNFEIGDFQGCLYSKSAEYVFRVHSFIMQWEGTDTTHATTIEHELVYEQLEMIVGEEAHA
jgi:hypothetical protein